MEPRAGKSARAIVGALEAKALYSGPAGLAAGLGATAACTAAVVAFCIAAASSFFRSMGVEPRVESKTNTRRAHLAYQGRERML